MSADKWDFESRIDTSTRTDNGAYDQVIALSQGLINENFQKLYDLYPELRDFKAGNEDVGIFTGKLLAPRVLIPGEDKGSFLLGEVFFQFRFKSGSFTNPRGGVVVSDLSDWVFTIPVPITAEELSDPKQKKQFSERFDYPGDYSIERLYMKLSVANWDRLDYTLSLAKEHGKQVKYMDWKSDNSDSALSLEFWLGQLMNYLEKKSVNSLGLSFKSPPEIRSDATFVPRLLVNQVHHYKSAKNGAANGQTGIGGAADCNCLMYLEMVEGGGPEPADRRLIWSGNFATQPESATEKGVQGTYLLHRPLFMDKIVLPQLRALNQASEIYHYKPTFDKSDKDDNHFAVILRLDTGHDPNIEFDDGGEYDFKPVTDPADPKRVVSYEWNKTNSQSTEVEKQRGYLFWAKASTEDQMKTSVTWTPGSNQIILSGSTISKEKSYWTKTKDDFNNPSSYFEDEYTVKWSLKLKLVTTPPVKKANGERSSSSLQIVPERPEDQPITSMSVAFSPDQHNMRMNGHNAVLEAALKARMNDQIGRVVENMQKGLEVTGKFTYPGNGVLIFEKPVVGLYADLNAQVSYDKLEPREWINVPKKRPDDGASRIKPNPIDVRPSPSRSRHLLTWKPVPASLRALGDSPQTLTILGTNSTDQPARFSSFTFAFKTGPRRGCLFTNDQYVYAEGGTPSPDDGVVKVLPSSNESKYSVTPTKGDNNHGITTWTVTVKTLDGSTLRLAPKTCIELQITALVGPSGVHELEIDEAYRNENGNDDGNFKASVEVRAS
ncbi:hypothetical protein BDV41DRAFT_580693 [Aspergillus transmontanensis]|uniref:Uncharacterized protein n=1 Tax=Aspergillus transmontanensis TaxID=1034304 RepID=A0A5N6VLF7_9EURO|nr:hypothetical protein BDV41DRAFT_580693 [Aspergillus transmontanensis]